MPILGEIHVVTAEVKYTAPTGERVERVPFRAFLTGKDAQALADKINTDDDPAEYAARVEVVSVEALDRKNPDMLDCVVQVEQALDELMRELDSEPADV
jgi:hypothetical protein